MFSPDIFHVMPPAGHRGRLLALILLTAAPLGFGALSVMLGQDANWDLRNYHWYNAYAFLHGRYALDLLPSQTPFFYNPTLDVPFYLLATHVPAVMAGFILGTAQGLNFILLFMLSYASLVIANPKHKVIVSAALAALGLLGGGGIALLGTTFYDNITSLGLFLSALLVIRHAERLFRGSLTGAMLSAFLFGLPSGLMMGLKLPCVIFCIGLCGALLFVHGSLSRRLWLSMAFGCGVLAGVAITLGHWAWFLQTHFGSPLFPYFNDYFKSPLAPLTSARDTQFVPRSWRDFLLFPFIFAGSPYRVGEIPWRDWRLPVLYGLLPAALALRLFFGRAKDGGSHIARLFPARYLLWTAVLSYGLWLIMFCVYRYAVPLEMLAPLLIVLAVGLLPLKVSTRAIVAGFILLAVVASIRPGNWHRRATWTEHFVEAQLPPLPGGDPPMILMAGFEPYAHLATFFPPEAAVVRIQSNFASPGENKGINRILEERIERHQGPFLMLIPPWQKALADQALRHFRLALQDQSCQQVTDRLYDDKAMNLCSVQRLRRE